MPISYAIIDPHAKEPYNPIMASPPKFIGLNTSYPTADGQQQRRTHLDGAASPLACAKALETIEALLPHYSNTHSYVHNSARISTQALAWAHSVVLKFLNANEDEYAAIFTGSGTTSGINRVVRGLCEIRPERTTVLVSAMEHHANDLPHRQFGNTVIYLPLEGDGATQGAVDLNKFAQICEEHHKTINYVAVSSVSNVTGIRNPIREMTEIAHRHKLLMLVDGAQSVAHLPTELSDRDVDFFVFSGHKVFTPMSPGVLVAKKALLDSLPGQDLGGGSVSTVSYFEYEMLSQYPEKEESGTPNIVGAIALASVLEELSQFGMDKIKEHDETLMKKLIHGLNGIEDVTVYGTSQTRIGAVAFNMKDVDHGLLAAILNDYFAIAVRNECFCAHPYVSSMIKEELWDIDLSNVADNEHQALVNRRRGMVRISISLYNTEEDIDMVLSALKNIKNDIEWYRHLYEANFDGSYHHKQFVVDWREELKI